MNRARWRGAGAGTGAARPARGAVCGPPNAGRRMPHAACRERAVDGAGPGTAARRLQTGPVSFPRRVPGRWSAVDPGQVRPPRRVGPVPPVRRGRPPRSLLRRLSAGHRSRAGRLAVGRPLTRGGYSLRGGNGRYRRYPGSARAGSARAGVACDSAARPGTARPRASCGGRSPGLASRVGPVSFPCRTPGRRPSADPRWIRPPRRQRPVPPIHRRRPHRRSPRWDRPPRAPLPFPWPRNGVPGPRVRYGCVPPVEVDDLGGVAAGLRGTA